MIHLELAVRLRRAVQAILPDVDLTQIQVRPCPDPRFGDYQTSALIPLAKTRRLNPRQLAAEVIARLEIGDLAAPPEVAGAGFINFRIKPAVLGETIGQMARPDGAICRKSDATKTVVVDFSSPNVAKPMHIGHIRSTILGDCLARVLRLLGHRVITDNHVGDWGTQFGKLIVGWKTMLDRAALERDPAAEMERLYRTIHHQTETDAATLERARQELVLLQGGEAESLSIWREMIALSESQFERIYRRLGVKFDHTLGESFYNARLEGVVGQLSERGIAQESEGAQVVFFPDVPDLKAHPAIIRKSDGAANYATTDLATLAYRLETWAPDEIVYVTDGRQQLHFRQVFATFRRWRPDARVRLAHVWFGSILGEDGTPFKTRTGDIVKLSDLLDEAEERAFQLVSSKNPELSEADRREIARVIGLGAVKYADLLPNRQSDYVFSWDKMLALNGNTAPYLLYAYTRIRSIFRREPATEAVLAALRPTEVALAEPAELSLALQLLNFGLVLEAVAEEYRPNYLCNYLFELAGRFTTFYENCPVLKASGAIRDSRLALCQATSRVLKQGLEVLGLETTDIM